MFKNKKQAAITKTYIVFIVLILLFVYATIFLIDLQFVRGEEYRQITVTQSLKTTELTPDRGTIYDAAGNVLAQSASVWTVALEPSYFGNDEEGDAVRQLIAQGLAPILDMTADEIYEKTKQDTSFTYLKKQIETSVKDEIVTFLTENEITGGVSLIEDYKRYYPYGSLASAVIGFTGTDGIGLYGIELEYDDDLTGTAGTLVSAKNAVGNDMPFQYEQMVSAEDGYDLVLTIDQNVQSICEKYLREAIVEYSVNKSGAAIVMNVNTGAIIAMATGEQFDLNEPWTIVNQNTLAEIELLPEEEQGQATSNALYAQWRNKAVSDTYEPGSVFKDVTAAAALDSASISVDTRFNCTGSYIPVGAPDHDPIRCAISVVGGAHGEQTVHEGLMNSCNPFFMQTAEAMGADTFFSYFEGFGFTEKTEIDLPGEAMGQYHELDALNAVELATASFGQGIAVTPIQMITAVAAVANGGYIVQPHVVDRVLDSDGNIVSSADTEYKRQVISEETAQIVTETLTENATTGGSRSGYVEGYNLAGKTGTSEKVAQYYEDTSKPMEYIVSYGGFGPSEDPEYALLVFLDEPERTIASGAGQAGPLFADIMEEILPYLGVESSIPQTEEVEDTRTLAPSMIGYTVAEAREELENMGLYSDVVGETDGTDQVVLQVPTAGTELPKGGKVVLYIQEEVTDNQLVTVPNFSGLTISECNAIAAESDIQVILKGTDTNGNYKAITQSLSPGEPVKPGTVLTVTFEEVG